MAEFFLEGSFFIPFAASGDCSHSLAHVTLPSSKPPKAGQVFPMSHHSDTDFCLLLPLLLTLALVITLGPPR